jgi:hypothetical protein
MTSGLYRTALPWAEHTRAGSKFFSPPGDPNRGLPGIRG